MGMGIFLLIFLLTIFECMPSNQVFMTLPESGIAVIAMPLMIRCVLSGKAVV